MNAGLVCKWRSFWQGLLPEERLEVMRLIGYKGAYPRGGVSATLMASLLKEVLRQEVSRRDTRKL